MPHGTAAVFDFSADNMESFASVMESIVEDMRPYDTMDLRAVSCVIRQLFIHTRDQTLPNVVSMMEFIYTKSENVDMIDLYDSYLASSDTDLTDTRIEASDSNQCHEGSRNSDYTNRALMESPIARNTAILDESSMEALIVLFPLSVIVSISTIIIIIFTRTFAKVFEKEPFFFYHLLFPQNDNDGIANGLDEAILFWIAIGLVVSPIWVPLAIILAMYPLLAQILIAILGGSSRRLESDERPSPSDLQQAMQHLSVVLDFFEALDPLSDSDQSVNDASEFDCVTKTTLCHNEAMMRTLPF